MIINESDLFRCKHFVELDIYLPPDKSIFECDLYKWCVENVSCGKWAIDYHILSINTQTFIWFEKEEDAAHFKLVW